ncbi:MAG: hypothetical protein ACI4EA_06250 [Candidatus Ornithomonoglobus sp.]
MTVKELKNILSHCSDNATVRLRVRYCPNNIEDGNKIEINAIYIDRLIRVMPEPEGHGTENECCIISG